MSTRPIALVTGASAGLGVEFAKLLAKDGYDLVLVARRLDRLEELGRELSQHGVIAHSVSVDLGLPDAAVMVDKFLKERQLEVDVLINNAGFGAVGQFVDIDLNEQLRMIQVNVSALVHLTGLILPEMIARGKGRVMNVASTAAFQPGPLMAMYYATKAFVLSFSEAVHHEIRKTGVTVTCVCPGPTPTEFQTQAKMEETKMFNSRMMVDPVTVAKVGYEAMKKGKRLIIPGKLTNVLAFATRLTPRSMVLRVSERMQKGK
ncbi:MAG TPA: SDR family oxidoreductase [Gemmatales bacterium]|nr:SDR family oxidoreductase [Gemmatales bacterium]